MKLKYHRVAGKSLFYENTLSQNKVLKTMDLSIKNIVESSLRPLMSNTATVVLAKVETVLNIFEECIVE